MQYTVENKTLSFSKPGLNPTTKNGTDKGYVSPSSTPFTPLSNIRGWLEYSAGRWIKQSDCEAIIETDPPPLPELERALLQKSTDGGITWKTFMTLARTS